METPSITSTAYGTVSSTSAFMAAQPKNAIASAALRSNDHMLRRLNQLDPGAAAPPQVPEKAAPMSNAARIVKVFIADANENLPLEKRVLYSGEEKLTDLTDQELFFEVPINDLLKTHNAARATTIDKKAAEKFGRDIHLEPARIRDLKMVVVTVAQF